MNFTRINVLFYLDPVGKDSGCIRLIPGSHRDPFHSMLRPLNYWRKKQVAVEGRIPPSDVEEFAAEFNITEDEPLFSVPPDELPCYAAETNPGDVFLFNMYSYHATYGGQTGRRMFGLNFASDPKTEDQQNLLRRQARTTLNSRKVMQHNLDEALYDPALNSDRPRIRRMTSRLNELGIR